MTATLSTKGILLDISTHTPLAGRDLGGISADFLEGRISTHTPLAGRDQVRDVIILRIGIFQLTRPSRGVTASSQLILGIRRFQLTRPSRGVT